ncbi:FAD binding domain-containing protein [Dehalobacter restrictus]|jgi:carbon-monoxide dehydrogenase medium subunit|uniref:Carbon monoxide dehydrogenase medium chain n=1 Tax=Dehalobacter restrictus (strain DSM 9455 / PER-K23) TaxID=871738 RepID=A0ABN4BWU4_DEHRP|nr:xanthine dehydrogenase family protein subunit M [Dehalobacter restrictus]AHF10465.1 carbon monoxide dehydrogenase medium chain [Dehalobacter restrictus DSM 9455]
MVLPKFEYLAPKTLGEANSLASELGKGCMVMAGGTDIIVLMKDHVIAPEYIIDLKQIEGLDYLDYNPETGLKIGALTTLRTIERSTLVKEKYAAVSDAAHYVASTQVRCKGTIAGNLCNASPSADTAPILLAMGAKLKITGADHEYVLSIGEFFKGPKKTALEQGEIVTEVQVPALGENTYAAYIKHAYRKAMDLAIVGVAAVLIVKNGICTDARIALGAVAATPIRSPKAEAVLIGQKITDALIAKAGVAASEDCKPISDVRASAEYRKDMIRVFTVRSIKKALESQKRG